MQVDHPKYSNTLEPHQEMGVLLPSTVLLLTQQRTRLYGMIKEMHTTREGQAEDAKVNIPELRQAFRKHIGDHSSSIRSLASKLGDDDALIKELDKGWGEVMVAAYKANMLTDILILEQENDLTEVSSLEDSSDEDNTVTFQQFVTAEPVAPEMSTVTTHTVAPEMSTVTIKPVAPEMSSVATEPVAPQMSLVTTMPVAPEMSTSSTQPVCWLSESEYEDAWPEYEDSDVDWEEWRDHPDKVHWQDWQDAWMSQDPRYLEQEIHCSDTPIMLLN